jgi:hypothetical protein
MIKKIAHFWDHDKSLSIFLWALSLYIFLLIALGRAGHLPPMAFDLLVGIFLLAGIAALDTLRALRIVAFFAVAGVMLASLANRLATAPEATLLAGMVCKAIALAIFVLVIGHRTLGAGQISRHRVQGGVAVYLLIGLLWSNLYEILFLTDPGSFKGIGDAATSTVAYFSFITLTTLGLGDITPIHQVARSLVMAEALIGQLFPAIFIARLVTLQAENKSKS